MKEAPPKLEKKPSKAEAAEPPKLERRPSRKEEEKIGTGVGQGPISVMLASVYDPAKNDPIGWYMSEKLDGVRCYWDGKNMYSRAGNKFYPPKYVKEALPKNFALDGELWTKRDDF